MDIDALILKWAIQLIILEWKYSQNALKMLFGKTNFKMHAFQNGIIWCGKTNCFQIRTSKMRLNRWNKRKKMSILWEYVLDHDTYIKKQFLYATA